MFKLSTLSRKSHVSLLCILNSLSSLSPFAWLEWYHNYDIILYILIYCIYWIYNIDHIVYISFQNVYIYLFIGVSGSIVAVLALAVLYECVKGLNVYLRSRIKNQSGRATVMKNKIYSEDIRWDFLYFNLQGAFSVMRSLSALWQESEVICKRYEVFLLIKNLLIKHHKYYWTSTEQTKFKKGQDWRKVNFIEFWCAKIFSWSLYDTKA